MTIAKRKLKGKLTEYQNSNGEWFTVNQILKLAHDSLDKKTIHGRLTTNFCKGRMNSKFKTLEDMYSVPKTKKWVRAKTQNKYEPDIFDTLSKLMR